MKRLIPIGPQRPFQAIWIAYIIAVLWLMGGLVCWASGRYVSAILCPLAALSTVAGPIAYVYGLIDERVVTTKR